MPAPLFRMGNLRVCPAFLSAVPRSAMHAAIVHHFGSGLARHREGSFVSEHSHGPAAFRIETIPAEDVTTIRLFKPSGDHDEARHRPNRLPENGMSRS